MGLLAIGLIGVIRLFPVGLRASKRSETVSKGTFLAQQQLEELKVAGYAALSAEPPTVPVSGAAEKYHWAATVEPVRAAGLPDTNELRAVTVTVEWPEGGQTRSAALLTYVTP